MTRPVSARQSHVRRATIGMRRGLGERAAGKRQAVGDEPLAERRQESLGAWRVDRLVDQKGEGGWRSHSGNHAAVSAGLS